MKQSNIELLNNPYGSASFDTFRIKNKAFVDKTNFIKFLDDPKCSEFPVLLRPRRFGKSTFVKMLKCFYDISYKDRYDELFKGTKIHELNLASHNTYHVLNFDFSSISTNDEESIMNDFKIAIYEGIVDFKMRYSDFKFDETLWVSNTPAGYFNLFIAAFMQYHPYKTLYIMIDEYDNFANSILNQDINFFRTITSDGGYIKAFYAALKSGTSEYISKIFITGVSSVSLDSVTSGFNIQRYITTFHQFNEYAGFTEDELKELIPKLVDVECIGATVDEIIARMKPVYDGYCFSRKSSTTLYNSSMCLYYLDEINQNEEFFDPKDYLDPANDMDAKKIENIFNIADKRISESVINAYLDGKIFKLDQLSQNINLNKDLEFTKDQLLSMLFYLGYLTIDRDNITDNKIALKIPNLYMKKLFVECIANMKLRNNKIYNDYDLDISSILDKQDDISSFAESCTEFFSAISTNQVLSKLNEMGINITLYSKISDILSYNFIDDVEISLQQGIQVKAQGENFADLQINVGNEDIYLIELKYITKKDATDSKINVVIKEATDQVLEYKSALDFKDKNVRAYPMIFVGPNCVYCKQVN